MKKKDIQQIYPVVRPQPRNGPAHHCLVPFPLISSKACSSAVCPEAAVPLIIKTGTPRRYLNSIAPKHPLSSTCLSSSCWNFSLLE